MDKVETLSKESVGKHIFFAKPMMRDNDNYTEYGLRSNISLPQNPALTYFENNIYDMVRNIEFRNVRNDFQDGINETQRRHKRNTFLEKLICFCGQVNKPVRNVRHRLQQMFM